MSSRSRERSRRDFRRENSPHSSVDSDNNSMSKRYQSSRGEKKGDLKGSSGSFPPNIEGMTSLKVDNITQRTGVNSLRKAFAKFGNLGDVYVPRYPDTFASRGFAFVRFTKRRDAEEAMRKMDGYVLDGKVLSIQMARFARPSPSRKSDKSRYFPQSRSFNDRRNNRYGGGDYASRNGGRYNSSFNRNRNAIDSRSRRHASRSRSRSRSDSRTRDRKRTRNHRSRSRSPKRRRDQTRSKSKSKSNSRSRSRSRESRSRSASRSRSRTNSREASIRKDELGLKNDTRSEASDNEMNKVKIENQNNEDASSQKSNDSKRSDPR